MNVELPYGRGKATVRIPEDGRVDFIVPSSPPALEDIKAAFAAAVSSPVDSPPLAAKIRAATSILLVVPDPTRDQATEMILALAIDYFKKEGCKSDQIRVLVARGAHRPLSKEEKGSLKQGPCKGITVLEHDCDDNRRLCALTLTSRGTPVRINRALKESELVVLISPVSFHYFSGFGGGRKMILPGCADRASIVANHRLSLVDSKPVTLNPLCGEGLLNGNPVHEDMVEALSALGDVFCINFFTGPDGSIPFINAGSCLASHLEAASSCARAFSVPITASYSVVVASAGGYPHDVNFLQSHKALRLAARAGGEGSYILFLAECREGVGSESLSRAMGLPKDEFLQQAYRSYELNHQTLVSLYSLTGSHRMAMVSELEEGTVSSCGIKSCINIEAFLAEALSSSKDGRVAVMPYAAKTFPVVVRRAP